MLHCIPVVLAYDKCRTSNKHLISFASVFQNFACAKDGPPHVGTNVEVLWSDGKRYSGQFHGTNHQLMFTVSVVTKCLV